MSGRHVAVVGGGIAGVCAAAWLQAHGERVTLFEKEAYLGGCAATFYHKGRYFNAGATTFAANGAGLPVYEFVRSLGVEVGAIESSPALEVRWADQKITCSQDEERFLKELQAAMPAWGHPLFWGLVRMLNKLFYRYLPTIRYTRSRLSLLSFWRLGLAAGWAALIPASWALRLFYPRMSRVYRQFLDAQVRIVAQTTTSEVSLLTAALALGYTKLPTGLIMGGMGLALERLAASVSDLALHVKVLSIEKAANRFTIISSRGREDFDRVICALPLAVAIDVLQGEAKHWVRRYYHDVDQGAFTLYLTLAPEIRLSHHTQILMPATPEGAISDAIFVSASDPDDPRMSPGGSQSVTISIHTRPSFWEGLSKERYRAAKEKLTQTLLEHFCATLALPKEKILTYVAATPKTWQRYTGRASVGGFPLYYRYPFWKMMPNDSPIPGLYFVGESVFAGQGWLGIIIGVANLAKVYDV
ncbi:MAG: FAD-dependent oxidoreductase [Campylobacterales bacterium]